MRAVGWLGIAIIMRQDCCALLEFTWDSPRAAPMPVSQRTSHRSSLAWGAAAGMERVAIVALDYLDAPSHDIVILLAFSGFTIQNNIAEDRNPHSFLSPLLSPPSLSLTSTPHTFQHNPPRLHPTPRHILNPKQSQGGVDPWSTDLSLGSFLTMMSNSFVSFSSVFFSFSLGL